MEASGACHLNDRVTTRGKGSKSAASKEVRPINEIPFAIVFFFLAIGIKTTNFLPSPLTMPHVPDVRVLAFLDLLMRL